MKIVIKDRPKDLYCLSLSEHGNGFDMNKKKDPSFKTMHLMVFSINGHLGFVTDPGKGTKVQVSINKMSA